jgi:enamine deaminase RidA (YjgF/YER057c/UK114 family)
MTNPEARLAELGIELPVAMKPGGNYVSAKRHGDTLYVSGHGPLDVTGKVGGALTLEQGYDTARQTGLYLLAAMREAMGSLDAVRSIIKLLGMVNCAPGFTNTPAVINGCSDVLVEVFGEEAGRAARSAVGMAELPFDIPVEVELIAAV